MRFGRHLIGVLVASAFTLAACHSHSDEGPAQRAGQKIDQGISKLGEKMEEGGEKLQEKSQGR